MVLITTYLGNRERSAINSSEPSTSLAHQQLCTRTRKKHREINRRSPLYHSTGTQSLLLLSLRTSDIRLLSPFLQRYLDTRSFIGDTFLTVFLEHGALGVCKSSAAPRSWDLCPLRFLVFFFFPLSERMIAGGNHPPGQAPLDYII